MIGVRRTRRSLKLPPQESEKFEQYFCTVIGCIGALMIGSILAWTSPIQQFISHGNYTIYAAPFQIHSPAEMDWIAALAPFGAIFGALLGGVLANRFGRKKILLIFTVPWIGAWILTTIAFNVNFLYLARFVIGIVMGTFSTVLPMYISEIAEESIKGSLGTLFQLFLTVGILLVYLLGALKSYLILSLSLTIVCVALFFGLLSIPESPNYLIMKNRKLQAERELKRLRGAQFDVSAEIKELVDILGHKSTRKLSLSVVFAKSNIMALTISSCLMIFQQFSGINAVIFFADRIFAEAGSSSPELNSIVIGLTQTLTCVACSILIEHVGRKILLLISCILTCVSLLGLGYYFWLLDHHGDTSFLEWLPLTSLVTYIITFALGLGPVPWMMAGDLFTPEMQSIGSTVTATTNLLCLTLVTLFFQTLIHLISIAGTFWLFAAVCGIATIFTLAVIPETKGKTAEQVQNILADPEVSNT